ncbi:hypothetical protein HDU81_007911 [Chytriomyces hyalinus]|nr:hypothetical protein HDU81_007911 [Chytriomyces hyalinus]
MLRNPNKNMCLDDSGSGGTFHLWNCDAANVNQQFVPRTTNHNHKSTDYDYNYNVNDNYKSTDYNHNKSTNYYYNYNKSTKCFSVFTTDNQILFKKCNQK